MQHNTASGNWVRIVVLNGGDFAPSGDIWQILEIFLVVKSRRCSWYLVERGPG